MHIHGEYSVLWEWVVSVSQYQHVILLASVVSSSTYSSVFVLFSISWWAFYAHLCFCCFRFVLQMIAYLFQQHFFDFRRSFYVCRLFYGFIFRPPILHTYFQRAWFPLNVSFSNFFVSVLFILHDYDYFFHVSVFLFVRVAKWPKLPAASRCNAIWGREWRRRRSRSQLACSCGQLQWHCYCR